MLIMRLKEYMTAILLVGSITAGCQGNVTPDNGDGNGNGNGETPDGQPSIPDIPEETDERNVFTVDFFTDLRDDRSYFADRDHDMAVNHIKSQSGNLPAAYLFDRSDFVTGQPNPMVLIAYETGYHPFFVQTEKTSETATKGTGIVTAYSVSDFDSAIPAGMAFMSGITIPVQLSTIQNTGIYTTTLDSTEQFEEIASLWTGKRLNDGVTVGKIESGIKDDVADMAAARYPTLRLFMAGIEETDYDLFVLCPAAFACRNFEVWGNEGLPCYRVYFEKLF